MISFANSKVRVTLQNSIKHFGREKVKWSPYFPSCMSSYCLIAIVSSLFVHLLLLSLNVLFMSKFFVTVKVQDYIMIFELLNIVPSRHD